MTDEVKRHLKNEFTKGPLTFLMNAAQLIVLVAGLFWLGVHFGSFKTEFETLQKTVTTLGETVKNGFDACAAEDRKEEEARRLDDKRLENAIVDHTGKAIR